MNDKKKLNKTKDEIIFTFDLGAKAGMVYQPPARGPVEYFGGNFRELKDKVETYKEILQNHFDKDPYAPKRIIKVIFFMDKWGFRRVATSLAEKRGIIKGILFGLRFHAYLEFIKYNESAVYSQMRKLHPSNIKEKKLFTTDLLWRIYNLELTQDAADAALLYYYYLFLLTEGIANEEYLTLK